MLKLSVDICAKKLIRWKVIKEYSLNIAWFFVFNTFIALVLLAFEATKTPKGQYASSSAGF